MVQKYQEDLINMKSSKCWTPLKLRALDDRDLLIFTQCLYESIFLPTELKFNKKEKLFAMAVERFTWEIAEGKDYNLMQVLSVLIVNGTHEIQKDNLIQGQEIQNLRSISNIDNNILILLNDEQTINLRVENWSCILEDIGKPKWPATTPAHLKNE